MKNRMIFGMPTLIELDSLEDTVMLCSKLGLKFVELNMNLPQYQLDRINNIEEIAKMGDENNIFFTIHLDENLNVCDFNRLVSKAYTDTVLRTISIARSLNSPILNMHMNHGVHFTLPDKKVCLFDKYFDEYMNGIKDFRKVCENAIGDSDIKICIENTDGYKSYEQKAIEYLLDSKVFGLTWDIGHSNSSGNVDEKFIMKHKDKLMHFHIHDSMGKKDHMTLGTGTIDINQRLSIADSLNCRCVVETKTVEALSESVGWITEHTSERNTHGITST